MTPLIHHTWLRRSLAVFAIAALLFTTGSQLASAKPADSEKDLDKTMCELGGGEWKDFGKDGYACWFDGWQLNCWDEDGTRCEVTCNQGFPCDRILEESRRQASLADDQKVVEPEPTPTPRGRGRSTMADQPLVVAPVTTPTPTTRDNGRSTTNDRPMIVASLSTPTPAPAKP